MKNLYLSDISEIRMKIYIKYVQEQGSADISFSLRFSEIDDEYKNNYGDYDCLVYPWKSRFSREYFPKFNLLLEKYKSVYPKAYDLIRRSIRKYQDSFLLEKTELFMKYLNSLENIRIPDVRDRIRFCDIGSCSDTNYVGIWFQEVISKNQETFIRCCEQFQFLYPNAYQKISFRLLKKNRDDLFSSRVDVLVQFLSHDLLKMDTKFCDIGGKEFDYVLVHSWVYIQLRKNFGLLMKHVVNSCHKYNIDEKEILEKVKNFQLLFHDKADKTSYRCRLFLQYLDNYDFPNKDCLITFHDLDSNVDDEVHIVAWFMKHLSVIFFDSFKEYKDIFPIGYERLMERKKKFISNSVTRSISFEDKFLSFMNYLEVYGEWMPCSVTFHDLDSSFDSTFSVRSWFNNETSFFLPRFISAIEKYRDRFPRAYQMIVDKINYNPKRLSIQRKLLVKVLNNIS